MKFENLLNYLDMGVCVEQLQREALVDLVVLFIEIDGVIDDAELAYTKKWFKNSNLDFSNVYRYLFT